MNSEKGYKQRTKAFNIPVLGYGDKIWPELEYRKYTIIENLLLAATRGGVNCVFDEGSLVVRRQENGKYCVRLLASGSHCAAMGICGGAFFKTKSTIEWSDLETGKKYLLYLKTSPKTFEDYSDVRAISSDAKLMESTVILMGAVDLIGEKIVVDKNPVGKLNSRDLTEHILDNENPHGESLVQDELVTKRLILDGTVEVHGDTDKIVLPASELFDILKTSSGVETIDFRTSGENGTLLRAKNPVIFVSVSRIDNTIMVGTMGDVSIEYDQEDQCNFKVRNAGSIDLPVRAFVVCR